MLAWFEIESLCQLQTFAGTVFILEKSKQGRSANPGCIKHIRVGSGGGVTQCLNPNLGPLEVAPSPHLTKSLR